MVLKGKQKPVVVFRYRCCAALLRSSRAPLPSPHLWHQQTCKVNSFLSFFRSVTSHDSDHSQSLSPTGDVSSSVADKIAAGGRAEGAGGEAAGEGPRRPLVGRDVERPLILAKAAAMGCGTGRGGAIVIEGNTGERGDEWILFHYLFENRLTIQEIGRSESCSIPPPHPSTANTQAWARPS